MSYNWASWIWTNECGSQSPVPYRLAIAHYMSLYKGWMMGFEPTASRATIWRDNQLRHTHRKYLLRAYQALPLVYFMQKAGDGNRTHVFSLEGWCSTIELHLQNEPEGIRTPDPRLRRPMLYPAELQTQKKLPVILTGKNRGDRIRTCDPLVPNQVL